MDSHHDDRAPTCPNCDAPTHFAKSIPGIGILPALHTYQCQACHEAVTIEPGHRIAQLVIAPVSRAELVEVEELAATDRGDGGFGSTGR